MWTAQTSFLFDDVRLQAATVSFSDEDAVDGPLILRTLLVADGEWLTEHPPPERVLDEMLTIWTSSTEPNDAFGLRQELAYSHPAIASLARSPAEIDRALGRLMRQPQLRVPVVGSQATGTREVKTLLRASTVTSGIVLTGAAVVGGPTGVLVVLGLRVASAVIITLGKVGQLGPDEVLADVADRLRLSRHQRFTLRQGEADFELERKLRAQADRHNELRARSDVPKELAAPVPDTHATDEVIEEAARVLEAAREAAGLGISEASAIMGNDSLLFELGAVTNPAHVADYVAQFSALLAAMGHSQLVPELDALEQRLRQ